MTDATASTPLGGMPSGVSPAMETPPPPRDMSLSERLHEMLRDVVGLFSDRVHLLALELRRAGTALAQMVALLLAAAVLVITAWLALWAGLAFALTHAGWEWSWVLMLTVLVNGGLAAWAVSRARRAAALLTLPATLRHLTMNAPAAPATANSAAASTPGGE